MLSDKEKQAIKDLIDSNNLSLIGDGTIITSRETIETVLNLIEKQSKEIEKLNLKNEKLYEDNLTLAQEIKEFIEGTNEKTK